MPMVSQTVSSTSMVEKYPQLETALNMTKAVAACMSTYPIIIADASDSTHKTYYVNMDPIGYPGWCFLIDMRATNLANSEWNCYAGVYTVKDGKPNVPENNIAVFCSGNGFYNTWSGFPETCVMIFDDKADTVTFDLHHGYDVRGDSLNFQTGVQSHWLMMYTFFFARDVNDDVLAGLGRHYITALFTEETTKYGFTSQTTRVDPALNDILHLTKMVNYLSPGYPEMKSAYVSVLRPVDDVAIYYQAGKNNKKRVSLKDIDGIKWGSAGTSIINVGIATNLGEYLYYPINPYVKY